MKAIKPFDRKYLRPVLYREDLEQIEKIIKEDLKPKSYVIGFEDEYFNSIDEIPSDTLPAKSFYFRTTSPYVSFRMPYSHLDTLENDPVTTGVCARLHEIIEKRERKFSAYLNRIGTWILYLTAIVLLGFAFQDSDHPIWKAITPPLLGIMVVAWSLSVIPAKPLMIFHYKKHDLNFFQRNKDAILIDIIKILLSGAVGYFIAVLSN